MVWLSVGQAAEITGISAHTLRYYERAGLLSTPRTAAGRRRYGPQELLAVEFIGRLRATGMPIAMIKTYADAVRAGKGRSQGLPLLVAHRRRVVEDLNQRQAHLDALDAKVATYTTCSTDETQTADQRTGG